MFVKSTKNTCNKAFIWLRVGVETLFGKMLFEYASSVWVFPNERVQKPQSRKNFVMGYPRVLGLRKFLNGNNCDKTNDKSGYTEKKKKARASNVRPFVPDDTINLSPPSYVCTLSLYILCVEIWTLATLGSTRHSKVHDNDLHPHLCWNGPPTNIPWTCFGKDFTGLYWSQN